MDPSQPTMNWNSGTRSTIRTTLGLGGDRKRGTATRSPQPSDSVNELKLLNLQEAQNVSTSAARDPQVVVYKRPRRQSPESSHIQVDQSYAKNEGLEAQGDGQVLPSDAENVTRFQPLGANTTLDGRQHDSTADSRSKREIDSEDRDLLMDYAQSAPATRLNEAPSGPSALPDETTHEPDTLYAVDVDGIEASKTEQELQRRYFDVFAPSTSDILDLRSGAVETVNAPRIPSLTMSGLQLEHKVRCLSCGLDGHYQSSCPELNCRYCGSTGQHTASACPMTQRCRTCRHPSHTGACPLQVAVINCHICRLGNHDESRCRALWRSFDPEAVELRKVKQLPVSCFNCGSNLHFGFDCQLRRPTGPQQIQGETFAWLNASRYVDYDSSAVGFSILGSAQAKELERRYQKKTQADAATNDDDPTTFIRPRVQRDGGRTSHIRFGDSGAKQGSSYRPHNLPERPAGYEHNYSYRHGGMSRHAPSQFGDPAARAPGTAGYDHLLPDSNARFRTDFSMPGSGSGNRPRGDRWQPAPPPGPPPPGRAAAGGAGRQPPKSQGSYRPMPSAGKRAWRKHRN